jgi:hypothetical protein
MATTTSNNAVYNFAVRWLFSTNHTNTFDPTTKPNNVGTRFLISKIGNKYFPFIWYETLITRSIPKMLGGTAGFQAVIFHKYYGFLMLGLVVIIVVYLSIMITSLFETNKGLYNKLNALFIHNEIRFQNFSYWALFKKLYLDQNLPVKNSSPKTTDKKHYSTTSIRSGPIWSTVKGVAGKKLIGLGGKLAPSVAPKAAPAVAKPAATIGTQGAIAISTGTALGLGVGGALVLTGGDQAIRYGMENSVNSMTQPNHKWPPFKMETPADVWLGETKK